MIAPTHAPPVAARVVACCALLPIVAAVSLASWGCRDAPAPPAASPATGIPPAPAPAVAEAAAARPAVRCAPAGEAGDPAPHGLALAWDSSLHCLDAPARGELAFAIALDNRDHRAVTITGLRLIRATPGPLMKFTSPQRGRDAAIALEAAELPLAVPPGSQATLAGTGRYLLERDGVEGARANLHALLEVRVDEDALTVELPLNLHVRQAAEPDAPQPGRRKGPPR